MAIVVDPKAARAALAQLPELAAQENLDPPDLTRVYVPAKHAKALHLDSSVVVGMRGAGKSWWTAVLSSDLHRRFVSDQLPGSALSRVVVRVGFGLDETERDFPTPSSLRDLLEEGRDPIEIWRTVVLYHALRTLGPPPPEPTTWRERARWMVEHRSEANAWMTQADDYLAARGQVLLLLFDAFDRFGTDWATVRRLTTAALKLGLELRSRRAIRAKFFLRPDFDEDPEIWSFPDSSKLRHAKVDLTWSSSDLYGLVFMYLGNSPAFGPDFRKAIVEGLALEWERRIEDQVEVFVPPLALSRDALVQRIVVEGIADPYMGTNRKRGTTFTWVPLHLADADGRISPRSYLLAFKRAAEDMVDHRPEHLRALHFSAIQQGVVKASEVRVAEIGDDYPWVAPLLEAARGATVPISAAELTDRWSPECLDRMRRTARKKLPPRRFTSDPFRSGSVDALIDDLVELAVLYRTQDGRLNIPDIFRVGFGIRRKGGVKPPR